MKLLKILAGFAAALAAGWIAHGPLGRGEAFIDQLDRDLQLVISTVAVPGVTATVKRDPLARAAILSGPADRFQREGFGSMPGLDQRVMTVPGMGAVEWTEPPPQ